MMRLRLPLRMILAGALLAACSPPASEASPTPQDSGRRETALFAGGCFWSTEANFEHMPGVVSAVSGFAGGRVSNPTYDQVVRGGTGHVEAVQVVFDPARITYRQLVDRFWRTIDPTDGQGQFCDRGLSYATAVFATSAQRPTAEESRRSAVTILGAGRFITPVRDAARFWPAGPEHQNFAQRNPVRYAGYTRFCGRAARIRQIWGA